MKYFLICLLFLLTWGLMLKCWSNLDREIALYNKISYEAMMCLQDKDCTLTYDTDI